MNMNIDIVVCMTSVTNSKLHELF